MALDFIKNNFSGGFNLKDDATKLKDEEYYLLRNGRNRNTNIDSILLPNSLTGFLPEGNKQGCYSAGNFLLVFVSGRAYFRDESNPNSVFQVVPDLQMDADVDVIYCVLIPSSTVNFQRKLDDPLDKTSHVSLVSVSSASPVCAVVQDGINQPWLIFPDGTARVSKNYSEWANTADGREYVPIGTIMVYDGNGILYMAAKSSPGGVNNPRNQIFRSVSGRPIDFVVAIDINGDKISPDENLGGAQVVSYKVDFDDITSMQSANSVDGSFYVSTTRNSYLVKPDFLPENLIFGEPTFSNVALFPTGCLNNFSVVPVLGDITLIDANGVVSFNAALAARVEGKNLPFSAKISPLFDKIIQDVCSGTSFDNYGLYGVTTIYGFGVAVYDMIQETWVSLDLYPNVQGKIKMWTQLKTAISRKLYFITDEDELFEWNAGNSANVGLYPQEFVGLPAQQHRFLEVTCLFGNIANDGTVTITPFSDRQKQVSPNFTSPLLQSYLPQANPQPFPFVDYQRPATVPITFTLQQSSKQGYKLGFLLEWDNLASLISLQIKSADFTSASGSFRQEALMRNRVLNNT